MDSWEIILKEKSKEKGLLSKLKLNNKPLVRQLIALYRRKLFFIISYNFINFFNVRVASIVTFSPLGDSTI